MMAIAPGHDLHPATQDSRRRDQAERSPFRALLLLPWVMVSGVDW